MCSYIDDEEKSKPESFSPESPCMVKGDRNGTAENGLGVVQSNEIQEAATCSLVIAIEYLFIRKRT